MRYHFETNELVEPTYGETYMCSHPVYSICTLYSIDDRGLAVIQQRFDPVVKATWWTEIDPELRNAIYLSRNFTDYFNKVAAVPKDGLYPTVTLRQIMHAMRMKPLKREVWETAFDHSPI